MTEDVELRVVFDCVLCRPACVNLNAILGGSHGVIMGFPPETWLLHATPNMHAYPIRLSQLPELIDKVMRNWKRVE